MSNTRALAKQLNENAVGLIEQILQKHTAAILDVVREQTHELEAEREKVRVLREALRFVRYDIDVIAPPGSRTIRVINDALATTEETKP